MGDMGDIYNAMREDKKAKHSTSRELHTKLLEQAGIKYTTKNFGVHLIVDGGDSGIFDFWPSTGKWRSRHGAEGRGANTLISRIKKMIESHSN